MRIVVVGGGGREHALAWKLSQSPRVQDLHLLPGNGGWPQGAALRADDVEALTRYCQEHQADLVVVGPETALAAGLVDALEAAGLRAFGPGRAATQLESSKAWAKQFMQRHGVATAESWDCAGVDAARSRVEALGGDAVLKYDGLAGGKGVFVCRNVEEASTALDRLATSFGADARIVVEQRLEGRELSIMGLTDGQCIRLLSPSQDHKQLLDGDRGPNTGGMGAFCPVPWVDAALLEQIESRIVAPTLTGLQAEGLRYCGVLYFGLMICADGPKLLEYNARLGDPETEVVLPALESDLVELIEACLDGRLAQAELRLSGDCFVDVVLASGGYPGPHDTGQEIHGLDALHPDTLVFHAGTRRDPDGSLRVAGGRVLNVVARGRDLGAAITRVYDELARIEFAGMIYRRDIGSRGDTA